MHDTSEHQYNIPHSMFFFSSLRDSFDWLLFSPPSHTDTTLHLLSHKMYIISNRVIIIIILHQYDFSINWFVPTCIT